MFRFVLELVHHDVSFEVEVVGHTHTLFDCHDWLAGARVDWRESLPARVKYYTLSRSTEKASVPTLSSRKATMEQYASGDIAHRNLHQKDVRRRSLLETKQLR
jgi:hypothetical protein